MPADPKQQSLLCYHKKQNFKVMRAVTNYLSWLTDSEILGENLKPRLCRIDQAIARSIQQGQGLRPHVGG